ncbi:hypothetical protein PanWU01x14_170350 [Parasponia andersonii]|uniref:Uncharacterized protein n=1 Tax=Parasponia andersonii TaxID=3476 RepID=A0A2P5CAC2_PARAD|nr:hypothetical protein PanWU01x14_170350 [Parasponia andersonii]
MCKNVLTGLLVVKTGDSCFLGRKLLMETIYIPIIALSEGCASSVQLAWCGGSISNDAIVDLDSLLSICSLLLKNWSAKEFGSVRKAAGKIRKQIRHIYKNGEAADKMEEVRQLELSL